MSKPENVNCPECDGTMVPRTSERGAFWGCKEFPRCRGTRNVDGEAPQRWSDDGGGLPSDRYRDNDRRRWR
jgi:ssDNA-binding Zn-finger/Zn-ribbon topoisomerase 1